MSLVPADVNGSRGSVKPGAVALSAFVLAGSLVACGNGAEGTAVLGDAASAESSASPSASASSSPSAETSPSSQPSADFPLSEDVELTGDAPMWGFPVVVRGWSRSTLDQNGISQLTQDGSEATFTSYQLVQDGTGSDEENSRAYLAQFAEDLRNNPEITSVSTPKLSTAVLKSDRGTVEFVQQELTYTNTAGGTYRSRFLARSLDKYVLSVHYAGPTATWSQAEWDKLVKAGLMAVLPY